jgi:transcriptional regulator
MTYRPPYFRVDDRARLLPLIADHPLATLITASLGEIFTTLAPMLAHEVDGELYLEGHIARANEQWKHEPEAAHVQFRVAHHYISPTWYPSKRTDPQTVPTFDYVSIDARGPIEFIQDAKWLLKFTRELTTVMERRVGGTWSVDDAPAEYLESQAKAIVGVRMRVDSLTGTFKLHQNHPDENIENVVAELRKLNTPNARMIAAMMNAERGEIPTRR